MNWRHITITALGAALPVLTTWLQSEPVISWPTLGKVLSSAALVGFAAAMKGIDISASVSGHNSVQP